MAIAPEGTEGTEGPHPQRPVLSAVADAVEALKHSSPAGCGP
jgi:hypothetical protein